MKPLLLAKHDPQEPTGKGALTGVEKRMGLDLNHHPADFAPQAIVGQRWDDAGPREVPLHSHQRGQLTYTARGVASILIGDTRFIVPPHRAMWLPPQTEHAVFYPREVAFRGIFVAPELCGPLPDTPTVVCVDGLLRELIEAAVSLPWDYPGGGPEARLTAVLLDRLVEMQTEPLDLPGAEDPAVARVIEALKKSPGDPRLIADWAQFACVSEKTLTRRFKTETGMSLTAWRERLRIIRAIELIGAGTPVSHVAMDLGYATPSSFASMFKRVTGVSPRTYFNK